jgi:hypothetical protein
MLMGECPGEQLAGRTVTLVSDRASFDTITPDAVVGNLYFFNVGSNTIGASTYHAVTAICPSTDPACAGRENETQIAIPLTGAVGQYVCVLGERDISTSANTLQVRYNNPSPSVSFAWPPYTARRLIRLHVEWPSASPALLIQSINFGSSANVIWTGTAVGGTSADFGDGTSLPWTSFNRSMLSQYRPLQIRFTQPVTPASGTFTYRVRATWDDTLGGSVCTSQQLEITLP